MHQSTRWGVLYYYVFKHESELVTSPSNESGIIRSGWDGGYQTKASSSVNLCYLEPLLSGRPRAKASWWVKYDVLQWQTSLYFHYWMLPIKNKMLRWMGRGKERTGGAVNQAGWETHVWDNHLYWINMGWRVPEELWDSSGYVATWWVAHSHIIDGTMCGSFLMMENIS